MRWAGFARVTYDLPPVDLLGDHHTPADDTAHPRLQAVLDFVAMASQSPYGQEVNPQPKKKPLDPKAYAQKRMVQVVNQMEDSVAASSGTGSCRVVPGKKRKQNQLQWRKNPTVERYANASSLRSKIHTHVTISAHYHSFALADYQNLSQRKQLSSGERN